MFLLNYSKILSLFTLNGNKMMEKKVMGYVCDTNPFEDRLTWSGLIYKIREAIESAGYQVVWIPYDKSIASVRFWERIRWRLFKVLGGKQILGGCHFLPETYALAKSIAKNKQFDNCDFLFFPGGGQISLFIKTKKPIIYYTDATVHLMIDYYWFNYHPLSIKMACWLEKRACHKALLNIRASSWATNSVIKDCNCKPSKCVTLEFGANIDSSDISPITPYKSGQLRALFSGVEWDRKGGDIAVDTIKILRDKGFDAVLHVVGIKELPKYCRNCSFIVNHGFLDKNDSASYAKYIDILRKGHIMLLPTQAECAGIVFCEAASFGIPSYTYATGGTENYVINGINGYTISPTRGASDFADLISNDIKLGNFDKLHDGALNLYKEKLSWSAWSRRFREVINSISVCDR